MRLIKSSIFMVIATVFLFGCATVPVPVQKEVKPRGWLGVRVLELIPELREDLKVPTDVQGLVVYAVGKDTPAHKAGLLPGDIIQKINNEPFTLEKVGQYPPETAVTLEIWRKGEIKTLGATLGYGTASLGINFGITKGFVEFKPGGKVEFQPVEEEWGLLILISPKGKDSPFYKLSSKVCEGKSNCEIYLKTLNNVKIKDKNSFEEELLTEIHK